MHVLFDARLLHRPLSGLERVQRNLIREISERPEVARLRVLVESGTVLPDGFPKRAEVVEVETSEDILRVLLPEDPADRPDVYHLSWFPDSSPRDLLLLPAAKAAVVEVHDAILNRHPEYFPSPERWRWYHGFVKNLVARADRLLVHSESVAGEVEDDLDGDRDKCDIAPLAVDPSLLENVDEAAVQSFLDQQGIVGPYFVSLGKDYPHKDHATLFRALSRVDSRTQVVIAGDKIWHGGRDTNALLKKLGLVERVRFVSSLSDDEVKALLQGSKGLVYPSLEEGFGLPPIEAMLRGVPVAAARCMSIPEVCGDAAWLFDAGDDEALAGLLEKMVAGGPEVEALVDRGTARAREFSWSRCAEQAVACYQNAIEAASRNASRGEDLMPLVQSIAEYPADRPGEYDSWQQRCLYAEKHARAVEGNRDEILGQLQELQTRNGEQLSEAPAPVELGAEAARPRWSLTRRLRKIRDGLRGAGRASSQ